MYKLLNIKYKIEATTRTISKVILYPGGYRSKKSRFDLEKEKDKVADEGSSKNEKKHLEEITIIEKRDDKSETSDTLTPADSAAHLENVQPLKPLSHLRNINITIPRGALVAVVGPVGSGKTSLLSALVGEMKKISGEITFGGSVGYCPQTAWIQNATLRNNVIFGLPFDEERYRQIIKDCCLEPDLEILPSGDQTEIGEKGINLSGGQKQRVNIARSVYYNADIVLLDDPLSAVDAHVGNSLFENCICGSLKSKTRILVTHKLGILQNVDYIIYMEDGEVAEQGTYEELMKDGKGFYKLINEYGEGDEDEDEAKAEEIEDSSEKKTDVKDKKIVLAGKGLMTTEERSTGAVNNKVYISYLRAAGGLILVPTVFVILVGMQGSNIGNTLWLSYWSSDQFHLSYGAYIGIYCLWGVSSAVFSLISGVVFSVSGVRAAMKLHDNAIRRVLRAPTSFFDTTPLGRIINRFSKDVDTCDNLLSESYRMFMNTLAVVIGTFILISVVFPWFIIPLVPLVIFYYIAASYYRATNRELKRLDSILRSSLYAHFSESLTGLPTIRAYREQERFIKDNEKLIDQENRAYFLTICIQRWLGLRLETIANLLIFFASLFSVIERTSVHPTIAGFVLSYALQVTGVFNWCVRQAAEVEANMNAVERLVYYSEELEMEAELVIPDNRPPQEWPTKGEIHIKNLVVQYGPKNPPVLHGISLDIQAAEKIGIVGRTGCGKSTLATSFFRFVEPTSGSIELDGIDISTIGLRDLRSKITIIPQDPVLFNGTLRSNLDPFNDHDDLSIWNALKGANLVQESQFINSAVDPEKTVLEISESTTVDATQKRQVLNLDTQVEENGNNFSQGQRQLIALARALIRHSKLIILDEATASVDFRTDHLIQTTIRESFNESTVITIAHRLRTVADYDKILLMDAGNVIEFDAPYTLMQNPDSAFRKMCEESGELPELMEIARQKFEDGVYRKISKD
ncbi:18107_t:CDS:10 [Acaulospora morrowiae]|uniref:18107_t:CDS:1 n=1 Tax=Acaulospora morrowiae TaxID=94023 RepID=A0A9N9D2Y9_9GLOM|nr:18107_t:CDS:10 [Acaulospora morrowiae]